MRTVVSRARGVNTPAGRRLTLTGDAMFSCWPEQAVGSRFTESIGDGSSSAELGADLTRRELAGVHVHVGVPVADVLDQVVE
jgi:hypothetical protein